MTEEIQNNLIQIKGIRDGLLVTVGQGEWDELRRALLRQVEDKASFFHGARLVLDLGDRTLHAAELGSLRDDLSERGISLWAVLSTSHTTEQTAQVLGMATRLPSPRVSRARGSQEGGSAGEKAVLMQRTLRSGTRLSYDGHVVVMGDVNPGAEIIADGNVIVWGKLRGSVHAGASGNPSASVCALELAPAQLRIAGYLTALPVRRFLSGLVGKKGRSQPEIASVRDGQIIIEQWNPKEK
ncbi:MAG: septum site-determining protein MinC [Chloroflexi bacterium]|nr:septum site-determining protein MinC [Chloroflexota bacterium]